MQKDSEKDLKCQEKLVFDSQKQANATATTLNYLKSAKLRPYKCKNCGLWHLTSSFDT